MVTESAAMEEKFLRRVSRKITLNWNSPQKQARSIYQAHVEIDDTFMIMTFIGPISFKPFLLEFFDLFDLFSNILYAPIVPVFLD